MRCLPPLVAGQRRWVLPMADASVVALGGLLLAEASSQLVSSWAELLLGDPPLALWAASMADRAGDVPPQSVESLAQWLAERALDLFRWEAGTFQWIEPGDSELDGDGDRVAAAVEMAEVAAQSSATPGDAARDRSVLLGLLGNAAGWFASPADAASFLPRWLGASEEILIGSAKKVAGTPTIQVWCPVPATLERCRQIATAARARWLAPQSAADLLPALTAKLARLAALENRFDDVLQTEKLEAMAEFAAGAGHEINNPLAVIAGRAQLFLRGETDPERGRALALINVQAMRIYEMIADMRLFARPPQLEPQRLDLALLVDRLIEELAPAAIQQETAICRRGDPGPLEIEADPVQLLVAVRALCQNSLEALGHQGHVELAVRRAGLGAEISVSDDGPGIPLDQRRHLFDPFYSARQAGRGLGLGLSKCWRIVTLHGGRIGVESGPGQGALFTIYLPPAPAAAPTLRS